jgi:hypothetical protein
MTWQEWLARVRHDLLKRLLWPARDRRDMGGPVQPGELVVRLLVNDEGDQVPPQDLWAALKQEAPTTHPALERLQTALLRALLAAEANDLPGVLALETAFDRLALELAREEGKSCPGS